MTTRTKYDKGEVLRSTFEVIPTVLKGIFGEQGVCVGGTWIAIQVLDYFGIDSRPMPVNVMAANAKAIDLIEREVPFSEWPNDAWSVGVHSGINDETERERVERGGVDNRAPEGKGWSGHLVAYVPGAEVDDEVDTGIVMDYTAYQMARPKRDLHVPPVAFVPTQEFLDCKEADAMVLDDGNLVVRYEHAPYNTSYRQAPDWKYAEKRWNRIAGSIIRRIRTEME